MITAYLSGWPDRPRKLGTALKIASRAIANSSVGKLSRTSIVREMIASIQPR